MTREPLDDSRIQITRFREEEHLPMVAPLTDLLHEAYKPLADKGFRYSATYQPPEKTLERLKRGESYLAFWDGQLIGTISLYPPNPDNKCEYYRKEGVYHFGQFAVKPPFQGRGIANRLLLFVEARARNLGGKEMALDTAESAFDLIHMYERRGYKSVSKTKWNATNYLSVVMTKALS
jgi:GNAT superfamily N-acetyltransferase